MRKVVTLLFVFTLSLGINAQDKVAKIEFETETIDYGTIEKGADGVRVFKFKNTGDAPLVVSAVKSTCGCTVPKKPTAPILPGESGEIEVKYDTKRVNPIRKTITVTSNAVRPTVALKIKGTVVNSGTTNLIEQKDKIDGLNDIQVDEAAQITLVNNNNDEVNYKSNSSKKQLAIFSEIYYKQGWKAYIDNVETPIVKANYVLRALVVPAGTHSIRFEFNQ